MDGWLGLQADTFFEKHQWSRPNARIISFSGCHHFSPRVLINSHENNRKAFHEPLSFGETNWLEHVPGDATDRFSCRTVSIASNMRVLGCLLASCT